MEIEESPASSEGDCMSLALEVTKLVRNVKKNFESTYREFEELKKLCANVAPPCVQAEHAVVPRRDLQRLGREVRMLKEMMPKLLNNDTIQTYTQLNIAQQEQVGLEDELQTASSEKEHWKARCENALADIEKEKEEKFGLRCELQEVGQQLSQQSEYCASMGAACSTLLWRVSRCEDSIQAILVGTKTDEFLSLVGSTVESYLQTYREDIPQEESEETQFILALCGIITNIAASPIGRDFLMKNEQGCHLVETFITVLSDAPSKKCAKMKNLILMSLYNLSINQKGLKFISSQPGILGLLTWHLQAESEVENRLHSLRLIQSLLYEQNNTTLLHEANEVLSAQLLQGLATDRCGEIKEAALELLTDLKSLQGEQ